MFKNVKVNVIEFMQVIDNCEGNVYAITPDGDKINMKSKLSQIIGIAQLFECGSFEIDTIVCEKLEDNSKIFRYLLYGEIERK